MSLSSVLITGSNRGIGLELVKQFVALTKPPLHIFAACRDPSEAKDLKSVAGSHSNVHLLKLDVKDYNNFSKVVEDVREVVATNGLNLLINNAGIMFRDSLDTVTPHNMMETFEVNTVAPVMLTKAFLPLLRDAAQANQDQPPGIRKAAVAIVSSQMGSIDDNNSGGYYSYRSSKAAANMCIKSLSVDLKNEGIIAVSLHPGWVRTDMGGSHASISADESVQGLIKLLLSLSEKQNGLLINFKSQVIPW